nr:retrotransposon protein, putative, unclassified [Tanacetum cinerariifolium]
MELPPHRSHDHRIPLIKGTQPVKIRPYRHPPTQKDAIEAMVKELLESWVIKPSHSPFASPIVMALLVTIEDLSRGLKLLKKNAFHWNAEGQSSFEALKQAMIEALVLGLPDFNEPFVGDASCTGLGVVLQQKGHPIDYLKLSSIFIGKELGEKSNNLSKNVLYVRGLPKSKGKDVIMVIVDKLSKFHGLPESIMPDRDKVSINTF